MTIDAERAPSPFWVFSLAIYGKPGVPSACLALQEKSGVDVNVLLFCLFAASRGRALEAWDVVAISSAVEDWKTGVVAPLRGVRTLLKSPPGIIAAPQAESLRARVKAVELEAERLQQEALFARFSAASLGAPAAAGGGAQKNIGACEASLGASFDKQAVAALLAAFDTLAG